jgi:hypothetical protein
MPQADIAQQDYSVGIVRGMGPEHIDPRALFDHINGLYEDDGGAYKRGGSIAHSNAIATPASHPMVWVWDGYFDAGRRTVCAAQDDFYALGADDQSLVNLGSDGLIVPKPSAFLEGMLFIGGGYIYGGSRKTANYSTGTISLTNGSKTVTGSGVTWTTLVDAGMLLQVGNERVYVVESIDSTTQLTLRDAYQGSTGSGVSYTLYPFYKMRTADPYEIGEFYAACANRLLTGSANQVKFSEIQNPGKWTLTAGAEEVPNAHHIAEGIRVMGLGVIGNTVIVLTTGGIWAINGLPFDIVDNAGNTQHRVEVLSRELVAFGQTATWQQTLIVPCLSGIFLIDGVSSPRRVSRPIDELYRSYVDLAYRPGQGVVYNDHLVLPITNGEAEVKDILVARLDRPVKVSGQTAFPWSRLAGDGVACPAWAVRVRDDTNERILLAANKPLAQVIECSAFWTPDDSSTTDADGEAPEWALVTRDYVTGGMTANTVRTVRPRYELVGDGTAQITAEYGYGVAAPSANNWDQRNWTADVADDPDDLYWEDDQDEEYFPLTCSFPESDGLHPDHCRVDVDTRFIRYRFRSSDPCHRLRFRSLEQFIRPSQATRR